MSKLRGAVWAVCLVSTSAFLFCCSCSFKLWNKPRCLNVFMIWWLRAPEDTASLGQSEECYTYERHFCLFCVRKQCWGFAESPTRIRKTTDTHKYLTTATQRRFSHIPQSFQRRSRTNKDGLQRQKYLDNNSLSANKWRTSSNWNSPLHLHVQNLSIRAVVPLF